MKLTKDQLAALRYADSDKGLDYMNAQLAAFLEGVKYARNEMTKADTPKKQYDEYVAKAMSGYHDYPSDLQGGPRTPLDSTLDNRSGP